MLLPVALAWTILTGALTPPPPAATTEEALDKWAQDYLDIEGWLNTTHGETLTRFVAPDGMSRLANDRLRIWIRSEYYKPQYDQGLWYRSSMELTEFDCEENRYRVLAVDVYEHNNMAGEINGMDLQEPKWEYPRPGTIVDLEARQLCELKAYVDANPEGAADEATPSGLWREGGQ